MAARRQWSDLSPRTRGLLITAAVAEGILKVAALIDIKRRPASQIRGPKWIWAAVVAVVSSPGSCQSPTSRSGGGGTRPEPAGEMQDANHAPRTASWSP